MKLPYTICYISDAKEGITREEVQDIFDISEENNNDCNIKGILLFRMNKFFQVLEGEKKLLLELFAKIKSDKRHQNIFEVYNRKTAKLIFYKYDSQFQIIKDGKQLEKVHEYLNENRSNDRISESIKTVLEPFVLFPD